MHEMSIISAVLDTAREEERQHPDSRVTKIGLRIGEWAGVDCDSLRFCFDALVATDTKPPVLDIQFLPRQNRCEKCNEVFELKDFDIACPVCGASPTTPVSGDELEVAYLELEET